MKSGCFIQPKGGLVVDAGFQTKQHDSFGVSMTGQMGQHQPAIADAAESRADVHPLEFAVLAADGLVVDAQQEKGTFCSISFCTLNSCRLSGG